MSRARARAKIASREKFALYAQSASKNLRQVLEGARENRLAYDKRMSGGCFLGVDPVVTDAETGSNFNRYAYASHSPYRYIDPDGRTPLDVGFLIWDIGKLGGALYSGVGVGPALIDVAISTAGVFSPIPGAGQIYKAVRIGEAVRTAEHVVDVAKSAEETVKASGIIAQDGQKIIGFTKHGIDRAIGDTGKRAGTKPQAILDALKNPKSVKESVDNQGRPGKAYKGEYAKVVVNPETGKIISTNPLGRAGANLNQ